MNESAPRFPYREKILAYPSGSKEALSVFFLIDDMADGKVVDARRMTGFATLCWDGLVTLKGELSEELLEELRAYDEYHTRRGREIRNRRPARAVPEGVLVPHLKVACRERFRGA